MKSPSYCNADKKIRFDAKADTCRNCKFRTLKKIIPYLHMPHAY